MLLLQPDVAPKPDDYGRTLSWLHALCTGEVLLQEQAWPEPHRSNMPLKGSLLPSITFGLGIQRICFLDEGARLNWAAFALLAGESTVKIAAARSDDSDAFYANLAAALLKAVEKLP